jgi:hypothetical protein
MQRNRVRRLSISAACQRYIGAGESSCVGFVLLERSKLARKGYNRNLLPDMDTSRPVHQGAYYLHAKMPSKPAYSQLEKITKPCYHMPHSSHYHSIYLSLSRLRGYRNTTESAREHMLVVGPQTWFRSHAPAHRDSTTDTRAGLISGLCTWIRKGGT